MTAPLSPEIIAATTEVLELAALLDHRLPTPGEARVMAWAKQIARHHLHRDDMLDAVQLFYDKPSSEPISVGDVVEGARKIKRDRTDREDDQKRLERAGDQSLKVAPDLQPLVKDLRLGPVVRRSKKLADARAALKSCHGRAESYASIHAYLQQLAKERSR